MAEYYFISQLPSLDGLGENMPLPITEERFLELCETYLGKKAQKEINLMTLLPPVEPEKSGSALIREWCDGERSLRIALGKARAEKMKKSFAAEQSSLPAEMLRTVNAAVGMDNPMEAEKMLLKYRLDFLETLRPMDFFSLDFVYYYGFKLKLLWRMQKFDVQLGEAAYRDIYGSILNGDRLEA